MKQSHDQLFYLFNVKSAFTSGDIIFQKILELPLTLYYLKKDFHRRFSLLMKFTLPLPPVAKLPYPTPLTVSVTKVVCRCSLKQQNFGKFPGEKICFAWQFYGAK